MSAPIPIAFWGTPSISAVLLERLLQDERFSVKFVVTQPDKPRSSRGRELLPSAVKKTALSAGLPILEPASLKKEGAVIHEMVAKNKIQFHIILAYGKIIPQVLFDQPPLKSVNFHASLLPLLRGASPVESALLLDYPETGWSLQRITTELDAGDVYGRFKVPIAPQDDAVALFQKLEQSLLAHGPDLLFAYGREELKGEPQIEEKATFCGKFSPQDARLNFYLPVQKLRSQARAFSARGGVYAYLNGKRIKIQADYQKLAELCSTRKNYPPGMLLSNPNPAIVAEDGLFWISGLQPEGKRMMSVQEFLNGYSKGQDLIFN